MAIRSDRFAAIAAMVTSLTDSPLPDASTRPVSVLQIMGIDDNLIPYEGGASSVGHTFLGAEESAAVWASHAGCSGDGALDVRPNGDRWIEWTDCPDGRRVLHIGVAGAGHNLPRDFEGGLNEFAWEFLSQHVAAE
jgi:poly(3-hydroxybutyrate) depolymerase